MTSPTVEEALKACPLCRGDHVVSWGPGRGGFVTCDHCGCSLERTTLAEAITAWNTRPLPIEAQGGEPGEDEITRAADAIQKLIPLRSEFEEADDVRAYARAAIAALTRPDPSLGSEPGSDREGAIIAMMRALHSGLPEDKRPVARMDFSDDQWARAEAAYNTVALSPPSLGMEGVREALVKERARWDHQSEVWEHAVRKGNAPVRSGIRMRHADEVVRMLDALIASITPSGTV